MRKQSAHPDPTASTDPVVLAVLEAEPQMGTVVITCPVCGRLHVHHASNATRVHTCPTDDGTSIVAYTIVPRPRRTIHLARLRARRTRRAVEVAA
jgi:hypothetical protein